MELEPYWVVHPRQSEQFWRKDATPVAVHVQQVFTVGDQTYFADLQMETRNGETGGVHAWGSSGDATVEV